jgi:stage II sporulation protein M
MSYKRWVLAAVFLFAIGLLFGLAAPSSLIAQEIAALQDLGSILPSLPPILTAIIIFAKNASVLLFSFALSPILCLMPILTLTINGWILTAVVSAVMEEKPLSFVLAALLPHGVIEISAIVLGEAAALSFGTMAIISLFRKENRSRLLPSFKENLKYLMIALGLLVPAALIETYVTPLLLK